MQSCKVWHCRRGHLNFDYLNELIKKDMVNAMNCNPNIKCALGKMQRKPFPKQRDQERKTTNPFEIVHSDVCGPMKVNQKVEASICLRSLMTTLDILRIFRRIFHPVERSSTLKV